MLYLDQEQGKEANQERSLKRRQQIDLLSASKDSQLPAKQAEQSLIGAAKGAAAGVNFSKSLSSPKNTPTRQSFTGLAAGAAGATGAGKGLGPTIPQPVKRVSPGLAGEAMNRKNTIEANIKKSGAPGAQLLSRTRQPEVATAAAPKITLPNYASYMAIEDNPSSDRWWEKDNGLTQKIQASYDRTDQNVNRVGYAGSSIAKSTAAAPMVMYDTAIQALKDRATNRKDPQWQAAWKELQEARLYLEAARGAKPDIYDYDQMRLVIHPDNARQEQAVQEAMKRLESVTVTTPLSADTWGMKLMDSAYADREKALEGLEGTSRFVGDTLISVADNALTLPAAFVNPAAPLAIMGAKSTASKIHELSKEGIGAAQALERGLISGGIEMLTEKIPLDNVLDTLGGKKTGSLLLGTLKQMATEAGEEGTSYLLNYVTDRAYNDPNAQFTLQELFYSMAGGALSGGVMGGASNLVGAYRKGRTQGQKSNDTGTGVNTDPRNHTPVEQRIIEEFRASVDPGLVAYYEAVQEGRSDGKPYVIAPVTQRAASEMQRLTGKEVYGNHIVLDENGAAHIDKRHGKNGAADSSMANAEDVGRIRYVLDNYDGVYLSEEKATGYSGKDGKPAPKVVFYKKINGTYYVVEAVSDAKTKRNYVVSAYMNQKAGQQPRDVQAPRLTSETATAEPTFFNSTIPQEQSEVNSSISNGRGVDAGNSLTPPPTAPTMESDIHMGGVTDGRAGQERVDLRGAPAGAGGALQGVQGNGVRLSGSVRKPIYTKIRAEKTGTEYSGRESKNQLQDSIGESSINVRRNNANTNGLVSKTPREIEFGGERYQYQEVAIEEIQDKNLKDQAIEVANLSQEFGLDLHFTVDPVVINDRSHTVSGLSFGNKSVLLNLNSEFSPSFLTAHEGFHTASRSNSVFANTIRDTFFKAYQDGNQAVIKEFQRVSQENEGHYPHKMSAMHIAEEVAADFCGRIMERPNSLEKIRALYGKSAYLDTADYSQLSGDELFYAMMAELHERAPQNFIGWPIGQGNDSLGFSAGLPDIGGTVQRAAEEVSQFFTPKPPLTGDRRDLSEGFNLDDLGRGESAFDGVRELLAASAADGKANKKAPKTGPANILTETPKVQLRENFEDTAGWAYRKAVDSGHSVEQAAKLVGDEVLYPLYNNAKQAGAAAGYMMGEAQTDLKGNRVGKSLLEIFDPVRAKGEQYFRDFSAYLFHLHNMDRMSLETRGAQVYRELGLDVPADLENKPVFGEEVTARDSEKAAAELLQKYPEFQQMAQDVYRYNQNLMQYRVDSGLISEKQAQLMNALYPHYVPTFRKTGKSSGMTVFGGQAKVAQTVQKATGSNLDLMPIDDSIARQTVRVISAAKRNLFGNRLLSDALRNRDKIGRYVQSVFDAEAQYDLDTEGEIETPPNLKGQFTVYLSGKPVAMKLDAGMMEGIQALSPQLEYNLVMKGIREANNLYKALITGYNPSFMIRNPLKDIQDAGLYTTDLKGFVRNYPRAVGEIRSNGKMWQLYRSYGGTGSSFFDYEKGLQPKKEGGLIQRIQSVNEALEQLPRLAEFITVVEKGGTGYENVQKALLAAADVTVNFGRSGTWGKSLNQTAVPFLNPSIQGADKLYRTITSTKSGRQWAMLALRVALLGVAPSVINELLYRDDEDYQRLSNRTKDTYFLFKLPKLPGLNLPEGQFLKLPKGRVLSVFGNAAQRTMRTWRGEEDAWDGYLETTLDATAPASPFSSNILTPILDADLFDPESPGKTWYGGDIEPQRLRSLPPGERYDESTDAISKAIGGFFNLSPKKINYLLDSYTGAIGEYGLPLITPKAEGNPFVNSFVVDSVMSNKYSSQFYDKLDEVTQDKNSANPMPGSAVTNRFLTRKASEFGELYAEMRRIELSSLSNKEKMSQVRKVKEQLNDAQKDTLDALDHYQEAAAKYYAKYSSMEEDDRLDTAYREANREIFGAEYALEVYNKKTYEKAQAVNEKGIPYDTFYRAYFAQKDVQGNKDRKGNTIAGSASENKKKAVDRVISGLTRRQREVLYEAFNISKTAW